jgi:two-component system response regulator DesR
VIRILLVAQTGLWRKALAAVLSYQDDIEVVAELTRLDGAAGSIAHDSRPDVVVFDIDPLVDADLVDSLDVNDALSDCPLLILVDSAAPRAIRDVLGPRVRGVFGKDGGPYGLAQCIRWVAEGKRVIDPTLSAAALSAPANPLTTREREILRVATSGVPSSEIAARMHLAVGTVRNHLSTIIHKTGGRNRMEAIRAAEAAGWL